MRTPYSEAISPAPPGKAVATPLRRVRNQWIDFLHLAVLSSLAVAQPIYDRLGNQTVFLTDNSVTPATIGMIVMIFSLGLPIGLMLLEWLAGCCGRQTRDTLHLSLIMLGLVLLALPYSRRIEFLPGWAMVIGSLIAATLGTCCYAEFPRFRTVMTLCAPAIILFPAFFLTATPLLGKFVKSSLHRSTDSPPVPVVMVIFDEFCVSTLMTPEREIDADRFPNFAALAKEATWYRNAASVCPVTLGAVPAILSGKYPWNYSGDYQQELFTILSSQGGYDAAIFEPFAGFCPMDMKETGPWHLNLVEQTQRLLDIVLRVYLSHISPPDLQRHLPAIPRRWYGIGDSLQVDRSRHRGRFHYEWKDNRNEQFQHFLECINTSHDSELYYAHFLLPHAPWCYLPSGNFYALDRESNDLCCLETAHEGIEDELGAVQNQQRHLLQVMYLDRLLGQLMDRLTEAGIRDKCLLIVMADHGISFRSRTPRRTLTPENADDILSIPLFIKRPDQMTGGISDEPVEVVDVFPTIADVLGIPLKTPINGRSLFDESRPRRTVLTAADGAPALEFDPAMIASDRTAVQIRNRFGGGPQPDCLFNFGPFPEIVGRDVASFLQGDGKPMEIRFSEFGDVAGSEPFGFVPCYFEGSISVPSESKNPVVLAVAINGVIQATTRSYQQSGFTDRWSVLVPDKAFHPGKNDVRFYTVMGPEPALTPCIPRYPLNASQNVLSPASSP